MAKEKDSDEQPPEILKGQPCAMCNKKTLTLMQAERDVPYFGKIILFSMTCSTCKYHKADIESAEKHEPAKYTLDVESEEDMKIRIVRSSQATIKIPHMVTIESGEAANGYVTNVEGILTRVKGQIESVRDSSDDKDDQKKAKNMLKKIQKVMWGNEKIKIILEDPSGNSAIVSEKAVKTKLK